MTELIKILAKEIENIGVTTVAKRAGLSRQHLYRIVAGTSDPTSENLEAISMAVSFQLSVSKSKYYPADSKKVKILDALLNLIADLYDPEEVWIFGSQARGDWRPDSDIDLMIIGRKKNSPTRGQIYVQATRHKIRDGFDAVFVTREDFEKQKDDEKSVVGIAVKEGHIIYSRDLAPRKHMEAI